MSDSEKTKNDLTWIQTFTKQKFFFRDEDNENSKIDIRDICAHLARLPRGTGAFSPVLSVAEHSVAVSYIVEALGGDKRQQLYGLLHDAHEYVTGDMPAPFKQYLKMEFGFDMKAVENLIQHRIHKALNLAKPNNETVAIVHISDAYALYTERWLYARSTHAWPITDLLNPPENFNYLYSPLPAAGAAEAFKERYLALRDPKVV